MRYISIGKDCHSVDILNRIYGRSETLLFDYMGTYDLSKLFDFICSKFEGIYDIQEFDDWMGKCHPVLLAGFMQSRYLYLSDKYNEELRKKALLSLYRRVERTAILFKEGNIVLVRNSTKEKYREERSIFQEGISRCREVWGSNIEGRLVCLNIRGSRRVDWLDRWKKALELS